MVWLNRTYYSLLKLQAKFSKLSSPIKFQRITQILRNSPTQSANYAKFAHFVNLFYIMFQAPAPTENPGKLGRINKIPLNSPTYYANYANSAHFAVNNPYLVNFQISDHRQRTQEKWSESTRFHAIRPQLPRITRNSLNPHHNKQTRSPSRELQETYSE